MYSMAPDGSDIICISFHETHEWHPSVNNNGILVYSRWDYVDRDTNIAHHIWTCFPDGRDPRSFHGNYPVRRENRPWMEMSIRAIPGSHRYVATTGSHHGNAFGSLVMIDPRPEDDGAMAQLTRLTPDTPFPEAEAKPIRDYMKYGTAWPLSEDDYLCVYDSEARNRGIYWIDRFGNRELIYRDSSISCLSPIPLRPRPRPPIIPSKTVQTAEAIRRTGGKIPQETITIVNIYDSDFVWPEGTKVAALRIIQALPKTTPPPNKPRIGIATQTNARAVLGTVPVEADGSAYFEAPVGKAIYFQALDAGGMAIQSMRSATYVHPGEQLSCLGCHEPKHRVPKQPTRRPLALKRPPSKIQPDVDGSNPFNYVRLVQPVLERNCVTCHQQQQVLDFDLTGEIEGDNGWTFHVSNGSINQGVHGGSRTIPGKFGAKASGLMEYMDERHHGVKLSEEDFHRLTLWLDCNSEFYGSYENTVAQAKGQIVWPTLD
ncbi:MAG: HzsA-related protein [Planctomycetota bacterium]